MAVEQTNEVDRFLTWDMLYTSFRSKSHANPSALLQGQAGNLLGRYMDNKI